MGWPRTRIRWTRRTRTPANRRDARELVPVLREEGVVMKETVGFIGLGDMGLAMATNLLKAGFGLRVYNRTASKARPLLEQGARLARSPAEATEPGGVVVTMVSDDRALEEVTLGANGLLACLGG